MGNRKGEFVSRFRVIGRTIMFDGYRFAKIDSRCPSGPAQEACELISQGALVDVREEVEDLHTQMLLMAQQSGELTRKLTMIGKAPEKFNLFSDPEQRTERGEPMLKGDL